MEVQGEGPILELASITSYRDNKKARKRHYWIWKPYFIEERGEDPILELANLLKRRERRPYIGIGSFTAKKREGDPILESASITSYKDTKSPI